MRYERAEAFGKGNKVENGGVKNLNAKPCCARLFDDKELGAHNPRERLEEHLSALEDVPRGDNAFFRTVNRKGKCKETRCKMQAMGVSKIAKKMKDLCADAGIGDRGCANHSSRSRMATALDSDGRNSEAIMRKSGHRSAKGLEQRMRPAVEAEIRQQRSLTKANCGREDAKEERKRRKDGDRADGGVAVGKGCGGVGGIDGEVCGGVGGIDGEGYGGVGGIDGEGYGGVGGGFDGKIAHCAFNIAGGVARIAVGGNS